MGEAGSMVKFLTLTRRLQEIVGGNLLARVAPCWSQVKKVGFLDLWVHICVSQFSLHLKALCYKLLIHDNSYARKCIIFDLVESVHLSRTWNVLEENEAEGDPENCPPGVESGRTPSYVPGLRYISTAAWRFFQHHSCPGDIWGGFFWPVTGNAAQRVITNNKQVIYRIETFVGNIVNHNSSPTVHISHCKELTWLIYLIYCFPYCCIFVQDCTVSYFLPLPH